MRGSVRPAQHEGAPLCLCPRAAGATRRTRRSVAAGLVAALVLVSAFGCAERGWLAPPLPEPLALRADGPWLRDARGRVMLLRGVDLPVVPEEPVIDDATSRAAFRRLEDAGVNLLRIRLPWRTIEPKRDTFSLDILPGSVDPLLRLARAHGMTVILALEVSQSSPSETKPGAAPAWACPQRPGKPEAESATTCRFWSDTAGDRLRDHLAETWRHLAGRYGQDTRVAGFEPLVDPVIPPSIDGDTFRRVTLPETRDEIGRTIAASRARQIVVGRSPGQGSSSIVFMAAEGAIGEHFARPGAARVAGVPDDARWLPEHRRYELTYHDDPTRRAHDPTVIHVPDGIYPEGFSVEVSPSGRWRFDPATRSVLVYRSRWPEHRVVIAPRKEAGASRSASASPGEPRAPVTPHAAAGPALPRRTDGASAAP